MRLYKDYADEEDFLKILQLFSQFDREETRENFHFTYRTDDPRLSNLREQFDYSEQIVRGKEFRSMVNMMTWVSDHLMGDGMCVPPEQLNAGYILTMTQKTRLKSNCFMHAVVLNEIFLSVGMRSRMVRCMPMDLEYMDCHCMTEVYCEEYRKWIAFDAANRAYYLDRGMTPLNLFEIRENLLHGRPLFVPMMRRSLSASLFRYLAKNLVRFESDQISQYDGENLTGERTILHFQSKNFPIRDKLADFPENRLTLRHLHTSNPEIFWAKPV